MFLFLEEAAFQLVEFVATFLGLLFEVHLHLQELIFGLELGLFLEAFGILAGLIQDLFPQSLQGLLVAVYHMLAIEKTAHEAGAEG